MAEDEWFVVGDDGEPVGPVDVASVVEAIRDGNIPFDARVCAVGSHDWLEIRAVPAFARAFDDVRPTADEPSETPETPSNVGTGETPSESSGPANAVLWLVRSRATQRGPMSTDDVMAELRSRRIPLDAEVAPVGVGQWYPIERVQPFATAIGSWKARKAMAPWIAAGAVALAFLIFAVTRPFVAKDRRPPRPLSSEEVAAMQMAHAPPLGSTITPVSPPQPSASARFDQAVPPKCKFVQDPAEFVEHCTGALQRQYSKATLHMPEPPIVVELHPPYKSYGSDDGSCWQRWSGKFRLTWYSGKMAAGDFSCEYGWVGAPLRVVASLDP